MTKEKTEGATLKCNHLWVSGDDIECKLCGEDYVHYLREGLDAREKEIQQLAKAGWFFKEEIKRLRGEADKYNELIMAVCNKYPNETRHETALRYIKSFEGRDSGVAMAEKELGG